MVVEGYFDRIALHRAGIEEALATCGTALSEDHARALRRRARQVVLLFDGDAAGRRAALRALELLLPAGLRVRAAALPPGDDPDTLLRARGRRGAARRGRAGAARASTSRSPTPSRPAAPRRSRRRTPCAAWCRWSRASPTPTERTAWAQRLALAAGAREADVEAAVRAVARGARVEEAADAVTLAGPAHASPDDRHLDQLVQALLQHPASAAELDAPSFAAAIVTAASRASWCWRCSTPAPRARRRSTSCTALEGRARPEAARVRLHALAASEAPGVRRRPGARRAVRDIARSFEKQARAGATARPAGARSRRASSPEEALAS